MEQYMLVMLIDPYRYIGGKHAKQFRAQSTPTVLLQPSLPVWVVWTTPLTDC
jgi:hypothetical protein